MFLSHAHIVGIKIDRMLSIVRNVVLQYKLRTNTFLINLHLLLRRRSGRYRNVK